MAKAYSAYRPEDYLWDVRMALYKRCWSSNKADALLSPLTWYIGTGRASMDFIRALVAVRPYYIACVLMKGGSDTAAVERVKARVGYADSDM